MADKDNQSDGCAGCASIGFIPAVVWAIWFTDGPIETAVAVFVALVFFGLGAGSKKIY